KTSVGPPPSGEPLSTRRPVPGAGGFAIAAPRLSPEGGGFDGGGGYSGTGPSGSVPPGPATGGCPTGFEYTESQSVDAVASSMATRRRMGCAAGTESSRRANHGTTVLSLAKSGLAGIPRLATGTWTSLPFPSSVQATSESENDA